MGLPLSRQDGALDSSSLSVLAPRARISSLTPKASAPWLFASGDLAISVEVSRNVHP